MATSEDQHEVDHAPRDTTWQLAAVVLQVQKSRNFILYAVIILFIESDEGLTFSFSSFFSFSYH